MHFNCWSCWLCRLARELLCIDKILARGKLRSLLESQVDRSSDLHGAMISQSQRITSWCPKFRSRLTLGYAFARLIQIFHSNPCIPRHPWNCTSLSVAAQNIDVMSKNHGYYHLDLSGTDVWGIASKWHDDITWHHSLRISTAEEWDSFFFKHLRLALGYG